MESASTEPVGIDSEWNPDAFSDRDWLLVAADRLLAVTRSVAEAASFAELLRASAEVCLGIGGAEAAGIYLLHPNRRTFTVGWEATDPAWPDVRPAGSVLQLRDWYGMVRALELGRPVAWQISDPILSEFEVRHYTAESVGSGIDVPLICRGETLGFLKLFRRDDLPWSSRDVTIAAMIGASIALALSSERLLEQALQQSVDQRALADLAQAAITPREPRDLLQRVAEQIRMLLPFPCVDIELWSTELDRAEIVAHAAIDGWPGPTNGVVFYRLSGWPTDLRLLRELAPFTHDVEDELPEIERRYFELRHLLQLHYIPLIYGERCLGAIVIHADQRIELDDRLTNLFNEVAAITTLAAHAARSIRDTDRERRTQAWQLRVNRMLLNETPLGTVLEETLASFVDMTGVGLAIIDVVEPGTDTAIDRRIARNLVSPRIDTLDIDPNTWPITNEALATRQLTVRRIADDSVDPAIVQPLTDLDLETVIVAPLIHDGRNCGTIALLYRSGFAASEDELDFVRQMARQAALVTSSHQLRIEQDYLAKRSAIMWRLSQAAISTGDPNALLHEVARAALDVDQVGGCEIERYDPATGIIHNVTIAFAGEWSYPYDALRTHRIDELPMFHRAIEGRTVTSFLLSDPRISQSERDAFQDYGINSVLVIPLAIGPETIGVLSLMRCEPIPFSRRAVELANELATHASLALGRVQLFEALRMRADSDGVTGLANHRAILERIDAELERTATTGGCLSLMLIDLDSFKQLNDARGHLTGDRYLREVAQLIEQTISDRGQAARYGGDEFLVLLPDCPVGECAELAELLLRRSREVPIELDGVRVDLGFSVGLATAPLHGMTRDELIEHADRSMYDAKQSGGGRIGFLG
ncbi:MAG: diguanylate cyclase [Thermomicrobiales bacterium]|nr:diguanylate cyclase [Thermomicrobiales bacterium]